MCSEATGETTGEKTVLVLGAGGGVGGEAARQLRAAGWTVRALKRDVPADGLRRDGIEWLRGDAQDAAAVRAAAQGCAVIVHAVNPPGYKQWDELVLPMLDNSIAAACATGATVVLPGSVYNFGPETFERVHEDSPQRAITRKGAVRIEMERRLQDATRRGARVLVLRCGDFFGPRTGNSWFAQGMVAPGRPLKSVGNPCRPGAGHHWAYLPDVGRTLVELLARRAELPPHAVFHLAGHWDEDGSRMVQAIAAVAARRNGRAPRVRAFPWWTLALAAPFVELAREIREMRYLWEQSLHMDNTRLVAFLGREPHTPLEQAVESALDGLGCLQPPALRQGVAAS